MDARQLPGRLIRALARGAGLLALASTAAAQAPAAGSAAGAWPTRPIRIVVPFPAGGTSDVLARLIGQKMSETFGQPVVVDNKPGNSGNLGADVVAKSPADGYTLALMDVGNLVISPALMHLAFNVGTDFAPVAMVAYSPHLLVVSSKVPVKTTRELIDWVKAQGGRANFAAAAGMGSATHLAGVMFAQRAGIEWGYVPYKGGAQAMTDLIGGQVDVTFNGMVATWPHVKSGKIRLIAVSGKARNATLGDVPTVGETLPGFVTGSWQGLLAPAGVPRPVVDRLHEEVRRIMALPEVREKLAALGAEPYDLGPAQFADWMTAEMKQAAKVVREGKVTLD